VHRNLVRSKECWVGRLGFSPPGERNFASNVSTLLRGNRHDILAYANQPSLKIGTSAKSSYAGQRNFRG